MALLTPERINTLQVLDAAAIHRAVQSHMSGTRALGWELWGLMVLVAWHEQRVTNRPAVHGGADAVDLQEITVPAAAARSLR